MKYIITVRFKDTKKMKFIAGAFTNEKEANDFFTNLQVSLGFPYYAEMTLRGDR